MPEFFDYKKTIGYATFNIGKKAKYCQHARIHWGFVEDVIRKDYFLERLLRVESFMEAYRDTIKDCITLHHVWLKDNKNTFFNFSKFRNILKKEFTEELTKVGLQL